jgi:YesN/AraC family two-component response regulator
MLSKESFDLVLMDVQMPVKDGFTTSRTIRENEKRSGSGSRIPIIAMTAHATKEYEQRCLESGMDGYLSKPASSEQLAAAIARVFSKPNVRPSTSGSSSSAPGGWNPEKASARLGGDENLLEEIIGLFLAENPKQLYALKQAIVESDAEIVERIAHTLKGELACLEMTAAAGWARELEEIGRNRTLERANGPLTALEAEISLAVAEMTRFMELKNHSTA